MNIVKFNFKFLFFLVLIMSSCGPDKVNSNEKPSKIIPKASITYAEGLERCKNEMLEKRKKGEKIFGLNSDCIVGSRIPNFKSITLKGDSISNKSLLGKLSIINFWFTTCPPCVAEIPGFNDIVKKYGKDKINFLAIGKDKKSDYEEFLEKHPWDFRHIYNASKLMATDLRIQWGYPTTFLVDENGIILYAFSGGKTDDTAPQELINKLVPQIDLALSNL